MTQQAQTDMQEISFKHKKKIFYGEHCQALEQAAQGGGKISILRDTGKLTGHGPEQPAVVDPPMNNGVGQVTPEVPAELHSFLSL